MSCIACGGDQLRELLQVSQVPVFCNQLCHSKNAALEAPVAGMRLVFCLRCEHLYNADFDEQRLAYSPDYENSLHFSAHFQSFAEGLAQRLIDRYELRGKTVMELGCGSGDFLRSVCADPSTRGFGFDASYPGDAVAKPPANVKILPEFFGPQHSRIKPDLVCARHVLEHIAQPTPWLKDIRASLPDAADVYLEVPNSLYTLRDGGIWDLIYEHRSYFSPRSVARTLNAAGFCLSSVEETFEGQFISVFASASGTTASLPEAQLTSAAQYLDSFCEGYNKKLTEWQRRLGELQSRNKKVIIWGAGSKGNTFLNVIARDSGIAYAVDLNPRKQGKFVAGTGQEVVAPQAMKDYRPEVVIVMNPAYLGEISKMGAELGLSAEYIAA